MRILADEHVRPAIVSALRGEGHNVAVVGEAVDSRSADTAILETARETDRVILSEDTDFQGANPALNVEGHPGILVCDTAAPAGEIAAAIRRIELYIDDISETVLYVPGNWL